MSDQHYSFEVGRDLFNEKKYSEASDVLEGCLSRGEKQERIFVLLGHCYIHLSAFDDANRVFLRLRDFFPESQNYYVGLGRIYNAQKNFVKGTIFLEEALLLFPNSLALKATLLWMYYQRNQNDLALDLIEVLVSNTGADHLNGNIGLLHVMGLSYEKGGKLAEAAEIYGKIKTGFPDVPLGYIATANLLARSGSMIDALLEWEKALKIFPDRPDILRSYCNLLSKCGRGREAMAKLLQSHLFSTNPIILTDVIRNAVSASEDENSSKYLFQLLHDFPDLDVVNFLRALQGPHKQVPWLRDECSRDRANIAPVQSLLLAAVLSRNEGDWTDSLGFLDRFEAHPTFEDSWRLQVVPLRADCLLQLGMYERLDEILESFPIDHIPIHVVLRWAQSYSNRYMKQSFLDKVGVLEQRAIVGHPLSGAVALHLEKFRGIAFAKAFAKKYAFHSPGLRFYYLHQCLLAQTSAFTEAIADDNLGDDWSTALELLKKAKYLSDWNAVLNILSKSKGRAVSSEAELTAWYKMIIEAKAIDNILTLDIKNGHVDARDFMSTQNAIRKTMEVEFSVLSNREFSIGDFLKLGRIASISKDFSYLESVGISVLEEKFAKVLVHTYIRFDDALTVAKEIRRRIKKRIPTSMIRLGDGEGSLLDAASNGESGISTDLKQVQQLWWGEEVLSAADVEQLSTGVKKAVLNADILGVPIWTRFVRDLAGFRVRPNGRGARGLLKARSVVNELAVLEPEMCKRQILTSAHLPMDLNYWNLFPYILDGVSECTMITSHSGLPQVLSEQFGFKEVRVIRLPGEFGHLRRSEKINYVPAFPDRHREIMQDLKAAQVGLFLVAAGILGKIYCQRIKELGGIALDIGAMVDYWLGLSTRSNQLSSGPIRGAYKLNKTRSIWKRLFSASRFAPFAGLLQKSPDVLVLSVFRSEQKESFYILGKACAKSNHRFEADYVTMYYVYRSKRAGTERYSILWDESMQCHQILRSRGHNFLGREIGSFYAYAVQHVKSQIQSVGANKIDCAEYDVGGMPDDSFFPIKDIDCHPGIEVHVNAAYQERKRNPDVSIVMAYYQRKEQFEFALQTIGDSSCDHDRLEIIIVDDVSSEAHSLEDIILSCEMPIKLVHLAAAYKRDKNYVNPSIPYNIALREAAGDTTILQNPEVCHIGDLIKYTLDNLGEMDYMVFTCANMANEDLNRKLRQYYSVSDILANHEVRRFVEALSLDHAHKATFWYSHPMYSAAAFHFLTATRTRHFLTMGGFLEEFAFGFAADDNELIFRIRFRLKLRTCFVDWTTAPFGIHQWHPRFLTFQTKFELLHFKNRSLLSRVLVSAEEEKVGPAPQI